MAMFSHLRAAVLFFLGVPALYAQGIITTIAGTGAIGNSGDGGPAIRATLGVTAGIAVDRAGNIYVADSIYNVVRKIDTAGVISRFAGGGNPGTTGDGGPATSAYLSIVGSHIG